MSKVGVENPEPELRAVLPEVRNFAVVETARLNVILGRGWAIGRGHSGSGSGRSGPD